MMHSTNILIKDILFLMQRWDYSPLEDIIEINCVPFDAILCIYEAKYFINSN
jgi:hypothetical protein